MLYMHYLLGSIGPGRSPGFFFAVIFLLAGLPAAAQSTWKTLRLDSIASVNMPHEGALSQDTRYPNAWCYSASTIGNDFSVYKFDLGATNRYQEKSKVTVRSFNRAIKHFAGFITSSMTKSKLVTERTVQLDGTVGIHQIIHGFHEDHQAPAIMELTWVLDGKIVYLFSCVNLLPEAQNSEEDKKHFFMTIHFNPN